MEKVELKYKLDEYTARNNFWTDKAITQLGYSINLFTTVEIALLGYLVTNRNKFPEFEYIKGGDINYSLIFYYSSLVIIFISVLFGFISILSRIYDFRLTRHLALTRKRFLKSKKTKDGLINSKIIDISKDNYFKAFRKNLFGNIEFVNETHFDNGTVPSQFEKLRRNSKILGAISWKTHKIQIMFFVIGILVLGFSVI
jgi:hypothetical protein